MSDDVYPESILSEGLVFFIYIGAFTFLGQECVLAHCHPFALFNNK